MVKKVPMRMCVGCREMKPKKELIRIVRTPEGEVLVDNTGKKSGRGAYICPAESCLTRAIKQKQLERSLEVSIGSELAQGLQGMIAKLPPVTIDE